MIRKIVPLLAVFLLGLIISWACLKGSGGSGAIVPHDVVSLDGLRAAILQVRARVPAHAVGTSDRVVTSDLADGTVDVGHATAPASAVVWVKAELEFQVNLDALAGLIVTKDDSRKNVTISLPSPRFVGLVGEPKEVAFTFRPTAESQILSIRNQASVTIQKDAQAPRFIEAAKEIYAAHLTSILASKGYTAEIVWTTAAETSGDEKRTAPL